MKIKLSMLILVTVSFLNCNGQTNQIPAAIRDAQPVKIHRFDKDLYQFIENQDNNNKQRLLEQYPQMTTILGKAILNIQSPKDSSFFTRLFQFYSEPTLKHLYKDAINKYEETSLLEQQLGNGFAWLKEAFPQLPLPLVYMHVSGFNQNILVADSLLSISIDKYLGEEYPLYKEFFYDFQKRTMIPERIASDAITGWIMSEYNFEGKENVLLDRMIYEGKLLYLIHKIYPEIPEYVLLGYTPKDLDWCKKFEKKLWNEIIQRKHLYTPELTTTNKYFEPTPSIFLSADAPGNLGKWIGLQIIQKFMENNNINVATLMKNQNSQEILTASKYRP